MNILKVFFRERKHTVARAVANIRGDVLAIYGISNPTDAQKTKASAYICIAGMALLNDVGVNMVTRELIDKLVYESKELSKPLKMRFIDLANNLDDLRVIAADVPHGIQVNEKTVVNGLAGFEALYFTKGEKLMKDILQHSGGPFGALGYAAIIITDGILGRGQSDRCFMELSSRLNTFLMELIESK